MSGHVDLDGPFLLRALVVVPLIPVALAMDLVGAVLCRLPFGRK